MPVDNRIEGFVAGSVSITVSNSGHAILLTLGHRLNPVEATISTEQSKRLRRLLAAAEKRARQDEEL